MGTTVSSLQMLGTTEEAVKTALPKAIVGKWSERFITACPGELAFSQLEKKAGSVSKKLDCTVLSVSLFDSDMLSLVLYVSGSARRAMWWIPKWENACWEMSTPFVRGWD